MFRYEPIDNDGNTYQLDYDPSLLGTSFDYGYTSNESTQMNFMFIDKDGEEESLDEYDEEFSKSSPTELFEFVAMLFQFSWGALRSPNRMSPPG